MAATSVHAGYTSVACSEIQASKSALMASDPVAFAENKSKDAAVFPRTLLLDAFKSELLKSFDPSV